MADNNYKKKKESIDDILSDLNGLLNKMPSILDGIKMPDMKPAEFSMPEPKKPEPAPVPEVKTPAAPPPEEKTVVMPAFSGLGEGAPEPKAAAGGDADKTIIIENFASVPEGGKSAEAEKLMAQSLGDFMFGEDSREAGQLSAEPEPKPEQAPPVEPQQEPAPAPVTKPPSSAPQGTQEYNPFESTRDFGGIPDIDSLLRMSDGKPETEPARETEPPRPAAQEPSPAAGEQPSIDELAEFEKQLQASVPKGETVEQKPEEQKPEEQVPAFEPEGKAAEPVADIQSAPAQPEPAAETLQLEPQASVSLPELPASPETIQLEPQISAVQPDTAVQADGGVPPAAQPEGGDQASLPGQGLVLEPASAAVTPAQEPSGDATLVMPPPSGGEDRTVVFEAGTVPGVTTRSQAGDLAGLADRPVPEGIPAERVRSIAFLYAAEDKALCATVMSELDSICLRSPDKPMFVKRAFVRECSPEMNGNYLLQSVADAGGQGLICVGGVPQEKVFEIESVFSASGGFFRHYDSAAFSHSAALDLVLDIISR